MAPLTTRPAFKLPPIKKAHVVLLLSLLLNLLGGSGVLPALPGDPGLCAPAPAPSIGAGGVAPAGGSVAPSP